MDQMGTFIFRYKKTVIILWLVLIIAFGIFAFRLPTVLSGNGFSFDGEYERTKRILEEDFGQTKSSIIVLFEKEKYVSNEKWTAFIDSSFKKTKHLKNLKESVSPLESEGMIKANQAYGFLMFDEEAGNMSETIKELDALLKDANGMEVHLTGLPVIEKDLNEASQKDLAKAEMIGLPIALIILLLAFGGVVAAAIPLLTGVLTILATMGVVYFFSYAFNLTIFILNIVPMIGLALSIDFALLFINRFKEEIKTKPTEEAIRITVGTAGRSIVFSALCVFIGLLGLMFIKIEIFQNVALGGMAVVFLSALSAVTFLPAILSLLGKRINSLSVLKIKENRPTFWHGFANFVMKHPVGTALLAFAILAAGLIPVKDMDLSIPGTDSLPKSYESRLAYERFEKEFIDPAKKNENKVVAILEMDREVLEKDNLGKIHSLIGQFEKDKYVSSVESVFSLANIQDPELLFQATRQPGSPLEPLLNNFTAKNKMLIHIYLEDGLSSTASQDWVRKWSTEDHGVKVHFGGHAKFEQEIFDEIKNKAPLGLILILVSTFVILMAAFRSVLIPLKAILMNILSISASFGIIVWIFQEGHFGLEPVSIALIIPVFVFSLVFGLSMDYEVFLISRIHENYLHTGNNNQATLNGLISTSKIITSAAAIMIVITGAFSFTGVMPVKQMGIGIALAIFIDATIVRMVLVPALMKLLGDWNWWFFGLKQKWPLKRQH